MARTRKKPQKESTRDKLKQIKKDRKQLLKQKRARLVVKNLPFKATEENLKEFFEKYGEIEDVKVLKKEDGKVLGCAFIQFKAVQKAAKAKHHTNNQPFLGRNINVDFALAKDKFQKEKLKTENEIKTESDIEIKEEPIEVDEDDNKEDDASESDAEINTEVEEVKEESDVEEQDSDFMDDEPEEDIKTDLVEEKKPHVISNDITEGKTVFIKNVPFNATNEDLKSCMKQFGPIYYGLICVDKFTEHSKGTAFVKFREKEDADKALEAGTELTLLGNILDCHPALGRNEIQKPKLGDDKKATKDSRNLYLIKEGVILAGTKAAEGVSANDMAKRLQLEQYKTQMLRNLNMFISPERIVIHNLPLTWDDKKLRTLFLKYGGKGAFIKESKIMRDMKNVDAKGVGVSKEFGFVTFTKHEHALAALRSLNNNPNIFSPAKRPIVAFSIENRNMVNTKQKRMERSRLKNPTSKNYDAKLVQKEKTKFNGPSQNTQSNVKDYAGVTTIPGSGIPKMRNRHKLKTQAAIHFETLKKEKKTQKFQKLKQKTLHEKKSDFTKQPKQKINKTKSGKDADNFGKLVSQYKSKLLQGGVEQKSKWYDT